MRPFLHRLVPQPLIAFLMSCCAIIALVWAWSGTEYGYTNSETIRAIPLALVLSLAVVAAGHYPIHYGHRLEMEVTTVPLYLMAVLLPPPVAAMAAGLGILTLELSQRSRKGNLLSDIATSASRWTCIGLAGALIAHLPAMGELGKPILLGAAAFVMFIGDAATVSFEIWRMTGDPPPHSFFILVRQGVWIEGAQYLLGILGSLAAIQQVWALILLALPTAMVYLAFKNVKEMREGTRKVLESMADAVDLRDPYTGGHSRQVAELVAQCLRDMGVIGQEATLIVSAARVHDIGKIGIPDEILRKAGSLTPEEWQVMKSHPTRGAELLSRYPDFARGVEFVRSHHERWDGKGYPRGLKGLDIPFGARVISVVDAFHAMTSDRPYRRAMATEQAVLTLRAGRGTQWDPAVIDAFIRGVRAREKAQEEAEPAARDQVTVAV